MNYDKTQKSITAIRLKECRNEKGLSHENLAKKLNGQYNIEISSAVLKNYEIADEYHTKFEAGYGMNIKYLYTLADFYGISTDYLLGKTDIRSPDPNVKVIHEYIGLSEEAINVLKIYNNDIFDSDILETINFLLEQEYPYPDVLPRKDSNDESYIRIGTTEEWDEWEVKNYKPILAVVYNYFKKDKGIIEKIYNDELKKAILLDDIEITEDELEDLYYFKKMKKNLKEAKEKFIKTERSERDGKHNEADE